MTRFAPPRRRLRGRVEGYADIATQADLAVRNVRVLARGTIRAVRLDENMPPQVAEAVRELAAAVRALADALEGHGSMERVREHALRAAATATLVLEGTGNLSVSVIVGQVRSTATDLLVGTGLDSDKRGRRGRARGRRGARGDARMTRYGWGSQGNGRP